MYSLVESNKPIQVVQFVLGQSSYREPADPSMIMIPPIEQYDSDYVFTTPKYSRGSYTNFFVFIVSNNQKSGLLLDGDPFPNSTAYNTIPNTDLVGGYIEVSEGTHFVRHSSPVSVFCGFLFGLAKWESYGMPIGIRMAPINQVCLKTISEIGDGIDNDCDGRIDEEPCQGNVTDMDSDGAYDEDCAKPPAIDGKYTSWAAWSSCSVKCNPTSGPSSGIKTRSRTCTNPKPQHDGLPCFGSDSDTTPCQSCDNYVGCFVDSYDRLLPALTFDKKNTIERCIHTCTTKGNIYAGVEYGKECFCGNGLKRHHIRPDSECDMNCYGDAAQKCGGSWRNSIYSTNLMTLEDLQPDQYEGCFIDKYERVLPILHFDRRNTVEKCIRTCKTQGKTFAGVEHAIECFCGDNWNKYEKRPDSECNMVCPGDEDQKCGGSWRISIYNTTTNVP